MGIKKIAVHAGSPYTKDQIFNPESPLNRDNCLASWRELKRRVEANGGECHTFDVYSSAPEAVLFLDIPKRPVREILGLWHDKILKCVILQEPELIIPRNWDSSLHKQFDRIFTWNDVLVDNKRYFKFNYGNALPKAVAKDPSKKKKLCAIIAGNQKSSHPSGLYSKREEVIRWFETHHPEEFDLYGRGWNEYLFHGPKLWRALNRVKFLRRILAPKYPSYKGEAVRKQEVLEKYRFAICYENSNGMPGYISEKIFDCFASGCVPVYWGAPNIVEHIPAACFLDKREFPTYEALYLRMKNMSDAEYLSSLEAVEAFMNSEKGHKFSAASFAETVLRPMLR